MTTLLRIFDVVEYVNIVSGAFLNSLLLYLIHRFSRKELGEYKTLLTAFAIADTFLCFTHWFIAPKVICFDTTFSMVGNSFFESRKLTLIYVAIFTVPFAIMNKLPLPILGDQKFSLVIVLFETLFQARTISVCAERLCALDKTYPLRYIVIWWGTTGEVDEIGTTIARKIYFEKYNKTVTDGWVLNDHWRNGIFNLRGCILLLAMDSMLILSFTIALVLACLTYFCIRQAITLSVTARRFHVKILNVLCIQTLVPVIFVYIPYFCVGTFPSLGWPDYESQKPDAIVIIVLLKDYREGLTTLLGCHKASIADTTAWQVSSMVPSMLPEDNPQTIETTNNKI